MVDTPGVTAHPFRPHSPERSWVLGGGVALSTTATVGTAVAIDGRHPELGWGLVAISVVIAALAFTPAARRLSRQPVGWILQYGWTLIGLVAIATLAVLLDIGPLGIVGLYGIALGGAAGAYPRRGALLVGAFAALTGAVTWALTDRSTLETVVAAALITLVLGAGIRTTDRLTRMLRAVSEEETRAARRNDLLAVVGRTVSLEVEQVAQQVVDGAATLGFDRAELRVRDDGAERSIASRRSDPGAARVEPLAVPVTGAGGVLGTLVVARTDGVEPTSDDVAVLEVLAQHAGHALANAFRSRDEQAVIARLQELDRLKRELVSNVSHDLRTPLTSLRGLAETLQRRADVLDATTAATLLQQVGANAERLAGMVDGLLDFRTASGLREDAVTDLAPAVERCVRRLAPVLADHLVEVDVPTDLAVRCDPTLLDHALENLLGNAAKYTPPGTRVRVRARLDDLAGEVEVGRRRRRARDRPRRRPPPDRALLPRPRGRRRAGDRPGAGRAGGPAPAARLAAARALRGRGRQHVLVPSPQRGGGERGRGGTPVTPTRPVNLHPAAVRAAASAMSGVAALLAMVVAGGRLPLSVPLPVYLGLGLLLAAGMLTARPGRAGDLVIVGSAIVGLSVLTVFAVDVSEDVALAVWWPLWAMHAATTGYTLSGWPRLVAAAAGAVSLAAAVVLAATAPAEGALHVGSYLVFTGLILALARHHADLASAQRRTAEAVAARTRLLSTLARMNTLEIEDVARTAVQGLAEAGYAVSTFGVVDPATELVHAIASVGFAPDDLDPPLRLDEGTSGAAFRAGHTVVIEDYAAWEGRIDDREQVGGAVGVPVLIDGRPAAVLLGGRATPGAPTPEQREVIEMLAAQATRVLVTAQQFRDQQRNATRLAELDDLKDDFIATVTHELRTPLTVILAVAETLVGRGARVPGTLRADLLTRLTGQAERLDQLIGALLYLSQLEAGRIQPRVGGSDAAELVELAVARATARTRRSDRTIAREVPPGTEVRCDPDLIVHVLDQLVANALVHNAEGTAVRVTVTEAPDRVTFAVADDGTGVDPEEAPHLTQRFFRGGPSTRRTSSGLGLGLATAEQLLAIHGSRLEIRSEPDRGTVASFALATSPASAPDVGAGQATAPDAVSSSTSRSS